MFKYRTKSAFSPTRGISQEVKVTSPLKLHETATVWDRSRLRVSLSYRTDFASQTTCLAPENARACISRFVAPALFSTKFRPEPPSRSSPFLLQLPVSRVPSRDAQAAQEPARLDRSHSLLHRFPHGEGRRRHCTASMSLFASSRSMRSTRSPLRAMGEVRPTTNRANRAVGRIEHRKSDPG